MKDQAEILFTIKTLVTAELQDARLYLFGSQATGIINDESDWDILVITSAPVTKDLKSRLHSIVYPVSRAIFSYIDLVVVNEKDWAEDPAYYGLSLSINNSSRRI
ncbi:nucleotidyltransferase domain-containing protein [Segetibacter sp. 3557_3]|uniref:nucleotidyltransferase domain-containing protein n=1 Tax=Segetibacter sp. 3557_3 TaxID=2547429 RepID=UPI001058964C|nr:nucleotidyltransferase domain-containing protein [Segetibacter sp. 3557_3]TDH26410.1 nucleotidyltransferase domain-containing protein [Segetibacter sp. 3557_3]